jgi:hypothetical protein
MIRGLAGELSVKTFAAAIAAVFFASGSWAALGAAPADFGAQALATRSNTLSTATAARYTVLETRLDSGTTIHEYLNTNGTVFAVSWSGPFMPDLKELLGVHFETMKDHAARRQDSRRSRLALRGHDVVIVSTGHMRALEGRAWLPSRLPAGFDAEGTQWPI